MRQPEGVAAAMLELIELGEFFKGMFISDEVEQTSFKALKLQLLFGNRFRKLVCYET